MCRICNVRGKNKKKKKKKKVYGILVRKSQGRGHFKDISLGGRAVLK
jgi:hypothetical protein